MVPSFVLQIVLFQRQGNIYKSRAQKISHLVDSTKKEKEVPAESS